MSKEMEVLECLEHIKKDDFNMIITTYPPLPAYNGVTKNEMFNKIEQALLELKSIKEASPSEALTGLERYINNIIFSKDLINQKQQLLTNITTIKQALLKAEKEHKALEIIKEKKVNVSTFIHFTKILKKDYEQCKANNDIVFCNICDDEKEFITEEEFNLLKECLE